MRKNRIMKTEALPVPKSLHPCHARLLAVAVSDADQEEFSL